MVEFFYNFLIHTLWGGGGGGDRGRGDVTAILQPKILKEIDFAWVQGDRGTVQGFRKHRHRGLLILHGYPHTGGRSKGFGSKDREGC